LNLKRLAAGAITDLCIDHTMNEPTYILGLINKFIECEGNMLTLAIGDKKVYKTIYDLSLAASKAVDKKPYYEELEKYKDINVRVGGWQAPFVSMELAQQENYILRILSK
jgi:formate C-acetyltransferase